MSTIRARKAASIALTIPTVEDVASPKYHQLKAAREVLTTEIDALKKERSDLIEVIRYRELAPRAEIVPARLAGKNDAKVKFVGEKFEPPVPVMASPKRDRDFRAAVREVLGPMADEIAPVHVEDRAVELPERVCQITKRVDVLEAASGKLLEALTIERTAAIAKLRELVKPQMGAVAGALVEDVLNFHASLMAYSGALRDIHRAELGLGGLDLLPVHEFGPIQGARQSAFGRFLREARRLGMISEKNVPAELLVY